jgi:hypothetical protein
LSFTSWLIGETTCSVMLPPVPNTGAAAEGSGMAQARFVFISDGVDGAGDDVVDRIWWRLVAANNRVLGRSVGADAGEDMCRERAAELSRRVDDALPTLATDARGRWTWTVALDAVDRAQCAHPFPRRVDCARTLTLFLQGLRAADPNTGPVRYFSMGRAAAGGPVAR